MGIGKFQLLTRLQSNKVRTPPTFKVQNPQKLIWHSGWAIFPQLIQHGGRNGHKYCMLLKYGMCWTEPKRACGQVQSLEMNAVLTLRLCLCFATHLVHLCLQKVAAVL